jgi:predicted HAD superfamily phosphohydrolase YqeG
MYQLIAEPDTLWTPQYRAAIERRRSEIVALLADLDGTLTAEQRHAARRQMLALADEIKRLASMSG